MRSAGWGEKGARGDQTCGAGRRREDFLPSQLLSQKTKEERSFSAAFVSVQRFSARDARLVTAAVRSASEGDVICLFVSNHGCRAALACV